MKDDFSFRYTVVGTIFAAVAVLIVFQLVRLQVGPEAARLREHANLYDQEWHFFYPPRGQVYDRWGNLIAGNKIVFEIGVELNAQDKNPETIALVLSKELADHLEYNDPAYYDVVFSVASREPTSRTVYAVLADFATEADVLDIKQWEKEYDKLYEGRENVKDRPTLAGLVFRPHFQRSYPETELASTVMGFVNREGIGFFGVEARYNTLLAGTPVILSMPTDPTQATTLPDVPEGATLILTIDREIQAAVEEILDQAVETSGSDSGSILVLDPRTGEILAMASTPRMDINQYWSYGETFPGSTPFNRAVSKDYEPGSVFKVLTMAAALDAGAVLSDTVFVDTGTFEIGGYYIHNWNWGAWGEQTMTGCLQHSLNVCLAWVATQLGNDRFYDYMHRFGIGRLSGVDLAGEVPGRLKIPGDEDWYEVELGTNSYGQGVAVTPLQLAMAISAVANDGKMMAPHILYAYVDRGQQYQVSPRQVAQPISARTAQILTEMLAISLEEEASDALVPGYRVAGKTGTADISMGEDGYTSDATNASFVGWGPVDAPRFLVYVWLEKPTSSRWGSVVAAPVFRDVVQRLVVLMNIPPDSIRLQMTDSMWRDRPLSQGH